MRCSGADALRALRASGGGCTLTLRSRGRLAGAGAVSSAMPNDRLRALIAAEVPALVECRRALHAKPELSDHEHETSKTIQRELAALKIAFKNGFGNKATGVVAHIPPTDAKNAGKPAVALRAD